MKRTVIVDYGLCNLDSIARAVEECGGRPSVSDDPADLSDADCVILPGVGSFKDAMANLRKNRLDAAMSDQVHGRGVPFLGICLGMQLMASVGTEGGETAGLGWIEGEVRKLKPGEEKERIPHVGWNEVEPAEHAPLFENISPGVDFYFVHGYHLDGVDPQHVQGRTPYCGGFVSSVIRDNIYGVQFHPEKSQKVGFNLLRNFLAL